MVRVFAGPISRTGLLGFAGSNWAEITHLSSVTWTESLTAQQTVTVRTPLDIPPEDWPSQLIVVPIGLDAVRDGSAFPPVYGPYDVVTPEYDTPRGTTFKGELGHHYGQLIADGSTNVVDQVVAQVEGFREFEPFLGWGRTIGAMDDDQAYEAAYGSAAENGLSYVASRVLAELPTATSLDDVATATAVWGFAMYILVQWGPDGTYSERLAVWPRHPLRAPIVGSPLDAVLNAPYAVTPRVGQVRGWSGGAPAALASVRLRNVIVPGAGHWKQRPTVAVPEVLNSPEHFPPTLDSASWNSRRIISGRRSLSGLSGFETFHTGGPVPPPAQWLDAAAPNGQLAKGVEELQRWDWQNSAAVFQGVRYPDLSADLDDVALAPHQLVQVPAADHPRGWDQDHRLWTVRSVRHEWDPGGGYRQNVQATLWQGPFARLSATAVAE